MTVLNSDRFINCFAEIEKWLKEQLGTEEHIPFVRMVHSVSEKNKNVNQYKDDLKEFAKLRNVIVHKRYGNKIIAEPNDFIIEQFNRIQTILLDPPKVISHFKMDVITRNAGECVSEAISDMRSGDFSQVPILLDGEVIDLLTTETIVRWMASQLEIGLLEPGAVEISEVLPHAEDIKKENYCILSRTATLIDALTLFKSHQFDGKSLDAVLITESSKANQKLLCILTVHDLPKILSILGLK